MGSKPNLSIKRSITIGTMVNFDGAGDGHGEVRVNGPLTRMKKIEPRSNQDS